jgi:hypothetical protein
VNRRTFNPVVPLPAKRNSPVRPPASLGCVATPTFSADVQFATLLGLPLPSYRRHWAALLLVKTASGVAASSIPTDAWF